MIASILITVISLAMFVYWFRYTSLLILSARSSKDYSEQVAAVNQLSFPEIRKSLAGSMNAASLDVLEQSVSRDYRVLTCLLSHAPGLSEAGSSFEHRMLQIDFKIMQCWFSVANRISSSHAKQALTEMTDIVAHFANTMGEANSVPTNA